jgi:hypothetical protein
LVKLAMFFLFWRTSISLKDNFERRLQVLHALDGILILLSTHTYQVVLDSNTFYRIDCRVGTMIDHLPQAS